VQIRLVVIAGASHALLPALVEAMRTLACVAGPIEWLSEGQACEFPCVTGALLEATATGQAARAQALAAARVAAGMEPVDVALVSFASHAQRRKKLLLADMDSTLIEQECIDELADIHGVGEAVRRVTAEAMRGGMAFEEALRKRVALLRGLSVRAIDTVLQERITLMPGAQTLIATMKAHGAYTALMSGGFVQITGVIAKTLGMDEQRANHLVEQDGYLTGEVGEPILGKEAKLDTLRALALQLGIDEADTLAVGDGANDIPMLQGAGMGVALHAKPLVRAAAAHSIDHSDLRALLYLQGYYRSEFRD
jgi:phosphoserine phosphatase